MPTLTHQLTEYVHACFTGIWLQTSEPQEALREIVSLSHSRQWRCAAWNIDKGLTVAADPDQDIPTLQADDPLTVLRQLPRLTEGAETTLMLLENFHRFLGSIEIVQALIQQLQQGKHQRTFVVILAPLVKLPLELEKLFVVLDHPLPTRDQLLDIATQLVTTPEELPQGIEQTALLDAAAGLTRQEAENAFSLSLIRHGRLLPATLWELKSAWLKQSGLLTLHRGNESFASLGGLSAVKDFCRRALRRQDQGHEKLHPKGILLLGVPGTGKSALAKALGHETSRPTLILDVGALFGSLVGQTEENIRRALQLAEAMAPCILFLDEIDKGFRGSGDAASGDSGVGARLFGTFLSWLNDHTSDVFVIATCNNLAALPPEFARAERFDGIFFLDLPTSPERQEIWELSLAQYGLSAKQQRPIDTHWTGAEIKACCRLAALLELPLLDAAKLIVPIATTAAESISTLRNWAQGRCLSAHQTGLYQIPKEFQKQGGRRLTGRASTN
ncbi:MAG: AAA family ATPase [Planctomycetaceae bacterium]|nr:AAA family ATPase [Planctomycetaceae bacterium]